MAHQSLHHTHARTQIFNLARFHPHLCMLMALLVGALTARPLAVAAHQPELAAPHAQAILLNLAAQQPNTQVRIIVQKMASAADVISGQASAEQLTQDLGGEVLHDLRIIHAFVAQLPAGRAL